MKNVLYIKQHLKTINTILISNHISEISIKSKSEPPKAKRIKIITTVESLEENSTINVAHILPK